MRVLLENLYVEERAGGAQENTHEGKAAQMRHLRSRFRLLRRTVQAQGGARERQTVRVSGLPESVQTIDPVEIPYGGPYWNGDTQVRLMRLLDDVQKIHAIAQGHAQE